MQEGERRRRKEKRDGENSRSHRDEGALGEDTDKERGWETGRKEERSEMGSKKVKRPGDDRKRRWSENGHECTKETGSGRSRG